MFNNFHKLTKIDIQLNLSKAITQKKAQKYVWSKVLQNALVEHSAILSTYTKLPPAFTAFVLSIF